MPTLKWHDWSPSECYTYMFYVHVSTSQTFHSPLSGQGVPTSTQVLATCNSWNSLKRHYQERKKIQHVIFGQNHLNLCKQWIKCSGNWPQAPPPPFKTGSVNLWWKSFIGLFIQWTRTDKMQTRIWSQSKCYTFQLQHLFPSLRSKCNDDHTSRKNR